MWVFRLDPLVGRVSSCVYLAKTEMDSNQTTAHLFSLSSSCHCLLFFSSSVLLCCFSNSNARRRAISSSLCTSSCQEHTDAISMKAWLCLSSGSSSLVGTVLHRQSGSYLPNLVPKSQLSCRLISEDKFYSIKLTITQHSYILTEFWGLCLTYKILDVQKVKTLQ